MSRLPIPPENDMLEVIFTSCISTFEEKKRERLSRCLPLVLTDAQKYRELVPDHIDQFEASCLPSDVTARDLTSVYKEKFVRGRTYYDEIKSRVKKCPICGVNRVKTLDHYLPESKMPTLAVTPINLIPACKDCNEEKRDYMRLDPAETPVHIYLEEIDDEPWLYTEIGENLEVSYEVRCPEAWEAEKCGRVITHMDLYKLYACYSSVATSEILNHKGSWQRTLKKYGEEELREFISDIKEDIEEEKMNSWEAALYRGLEENFQTLVDYLRRESGVFAASA